MELPDWQKQIEQGKLNQQTSMTDAFLVALYFSCLSQFNIDQREQFVYYWQRKIFEKFLPIRLNFNLFDIIVNQKGRFFDEK